MRRTSCTSTRAALAGLAVVLALVAAACSDDEPTAEPVPETTTSVPEPAPTVAPLDDDEFAAQLAPALEELDAAGTDLCAVLAVLVTSAGPEAPPSSPEQVRATLDAQATLFRALAATEPVDEPSAALVLAAADELVELSRSDDLSPATLESEEYLSIFDAMQPGFDAYQERQAQECDAPGLGEAPSDEVG